MSPNDLWCTWMIFLFGFYCGLLIAFLMFNFITGWKHV